MSYRFSLSPTVLRLRIMRLGMAALVGSALTFNLAAADEPGQAKLDQATELKIDAETPDQLSKVMELCEQAIKEGLDESGIEFANQMLGASAFERAQMVAQQMAAGRLTPPAFNRLRQEAMKDLKKAVEADPKLLEAHLLMARLSALPGGSRKAALASVDKAIEVSADDPSEQSKAYVLRAQIVEDVDDKLSDLKKAVEINSDNIEALQLRAALLLSQNKKEEALTDIQTWLAKDSENLIAVQTAIEVLVQLDRIDDAIDLISKRIETQADVAALYRIRGVLYHSQEKDDQALVDLNKTLELDPRDAAALLLRGEINFDEGNVDAANKDISEAMLIEPNSVRGVVMRSLVAAREKRYGDAIKDMLLLVRAEPDNPAWLMQLASYYQLDDRPRTAIKIMDELVKKNPKNWQALRVRGDAYLSISEHKKAVDDYQAAIDVVENDDVEKSGLLNNLAWVLATSPEDSIRDGKRSVELGLKACELTEYKEAHILSTLAAGYAEQGDFENAKKWAAKAVEVGTEEGAEQLDQLKKELKSYEEGNAWREEQDTPENDTPILPPGQTIDT